MRSAIYEGRVRHRRRVDVPHEFGYRLYMMFLDLAELPGLFRTRWLWSARGPNLVWFRRRDYLGPPSLPLDVAVRNLVEAQTGRRPRGPIRMLTHLRTLGTCFNPVTFYYCYAPSGEGLEAIVADITNTPWLERRAYVLPCEDPEAARHRWRFAKAFHVSPFLAMDYEHDWCFSPPSSRLLVHMENRRDGASWFDATLAMKRVEITSRSLARVLLRYPWMTLKVVLAIYAQAFRLWRKGATFHPHPRKAAASPRPTARKGDRVPNRPRSAAAPHAPALDPDPGAPPPGAPRDRQPHAARR